MPELPEVERAASLLRKITETHPHIRHVETAEDTIVYTGTTHEEFAEELTTRNVSNVGRYGKLFYFELDGEGRHPVFHFGMTGLLQVKGHLPVHYRSAPRNASDDWPPKFMKFIIHFSISRNSPPEDDTLVAFLDPRRLGRIRLVSSPTQDPPISNLGFDPVLRMLPLSEFSTLLLKRTCPIKALLLDQSFSAGVGNWVADEILYHARVHPEQRCSTMSREQVEAVWKWTEEVPKTAVSLNADDKKFPEDWLFKHRWGKGKKAKKPRQGEEVAEQIGLLLPSGQPATIKFLTVGGRTSAFVAELQHLNSTQADPKAVTAVAAADTCADVDKDGGGPTTKAKAGVKRKNVEMAPAAKRPTKKAVANKQASEQDGSESDLTSLNSDDETEAEVQPEVVTKRKKTGKTVAAVSTPAAKKPSKAEAVAAQTGRSTRSKKAAR